MDESKAPLTELAPLYPAYNPSYNPASYQMQPANVGQQGQVVVPQGNIQSKEEEQNNKKANSGLEDGDDLTPGTNPGGIPDKHFNVSCYFNRISYFIKIKFKLAYNSQ